MNIENLLSRASSNKGASLFDVRLCHKTQKDGVFSTEYLYCSNEVVENKRKNRNKDEYGNVSLSDRQTHEKDGIILSLT